MRVVVRTTTESLSDSTPADTGSTAASAAGTGSTPSGDGTSASSTPGGKPTPPTGDGNATGTSAAGAEGAVISQAEEPEGRPSPAPTAQAITCHGYSEGQHGLKLTDADGEKCGYVPYAELLRIVPE